MQLHSNFYKVQYIPKCDNLSQSKLEASKQLPSIQADLCSFNGRKEAIISIQNLQKHVNYLASVQCEGREPGTKGSYLARRYIIKNFKKYGLKPFNKIIKNEQDCYVQKDCLTKYHRFTGEKIKNVKIRNVIGYLPANSDEYLFVTAHYDHLGRNKTGEIYLGAEDNATGIATILEAARVLHNEKLSKNIVFVATDAEEQGFLGAISLAKRMESMNIKGNSEVLNLDGLGAAGDWLSIIGGKETNFSKYDLDNITKLKKLSNATAKSCKKLGIKVRHFPANFTDSRAFQEADIPAITYTWTKKGSKDAEQNRLHVHTISDTPDKVQFENVKNTSQVLLNTILELCK